MSGQDAAPGEDAAAEEQAGPDTAAGEPTGADATPAGPPAGAGSGLDETDREILAIENLQWKYQGAKEMEIRRRLGLSPTHYYQRLNVLIDSRAALEHDPMLVGRLRRQRGDLG
ncbi:DUF3263 domain-containing protein [Kocuria sediminis]|uniref:DUF3263 domain-containing protein n=1 Tax=Kocuria sediminis TaxID=1038857 RepID=A0A6N8GK15_9MICC|nr:DUF3263 domain-containing protein [Kocuria sediminis]MUN62597.1 DUF3263 domain-containing protein [Kocuria sediminis]